MAQSTCPAPSDPDVCSPLKWAHGIDSACGLIMFVCFWLLVLKVDLGSELQSPVIAFRRFFLSCVSDLLKDLRATARLLGEMPHAPLEERLRYCERLDELANVTSAALAFLAVTRWLRVGGVNGMRYVSYALTFPLAQIELLSLLAPFVPCFLGLCSFATLITVMMVFTVYGASLLRMPVYNGDMMHLFRTWRLEDLDPTMKLVVACPALAGLAMQSSILLPYYFTAYTVLGGATHRNLPEGFGWLLAIDFFKWWGFAIWWMIAWEGNAVIDDVRFNELGFTIIHMVAKGLVSFQTHRMAELQQEKEKVHVERDRRMSLVQQSQRGFPPPRVRNGRRPSLESAFSEEPAEMSEIVVHCHSTRSGVDRKLPMVNFLKTDAAESEHNTSDADSTGSPKIYTVSFS